MALVLWRNNRRNANECERRMGEIPTQWTFRFDVFFLPSSRSLFTVRIRVESDDVDAGVNDLQKSVPVRKLRGF